MWIYSNARYNEIWLQIKHNIFKNPNWQEADQLAIYNAWKR